MNRYQREFGFKMSSRAVIVDDIRVRGVGKTDVRSEAQITEGGKPPVEKVHLYI